MKSLLRNFFDFLDFNVSQSVMHVCVNIEISMV